jgi:hypothetical protein
VTTNKTSRWVVVETETHLAEFQGAKLRLFVSRHDGSDTRRDPRAPEKWYQAVASWSREEALAETHQILNRLGISFPIEREEYEAIPIDVRNPQGQITRVTPFHNVRLYTTNDALAIKAEFRMGESGPGRLTRWFDNTPQD